MSAKESEEKMSDQTISEQNAPEPADYDLDEDLDKAGDKSYSQGSLVWRRFLHHKGAMVASAILILVILLAFSSTGVGFLPGWWPKNHVDLYSFPQGSPNGEPTLRLWPFTLGEHPGAHKDTSEVAADSLVEQHGCYRRVYTTRKPQQHLLVTNGLADFLNFHVNEVIHRPVAFSSTNIKSKVAQDIVAKL